MIYLPTLIFVVLGAKGKLFSAGIDVSVLEQGTPQYAIRYIQKLQEYYNCWEKVSTYYYGCTQHLYRWPVKISSAVISAYSLNPPRICRRLTSVCHPI